MKNNQTLEYYLKQTRIGDECTFSHIKQKEYYYAIIYRSMHGQKEFYIDSNNEVMGGYGLVFVSEIETINNILQKYKEEQENNND